MGSPAYAPHCTPPREKRSGSANTSSGTFAAHNGSVKPIAAARSTEGPSPLPRRSDTNPPRTEIAPGSVLQKPEALAQDALASKNSLVLRQRRFGVDVGQGLFLLISRPTHLEPPPWKEKHLRLYPPTGSLFLSTPGSISVSGNAQGPLCNLIANPFGHPSPELFESAPAASANSWASKHPTGVG